MQSSEFQFLAELLKRRSGLQLTDDKVYLIESRLLPITRAHNLADLSALCAELRLRPTEALLVEVTEAMTTNESSFFRDIKPYDCLRNILLPRVMAAKTDKTIRIWSAACSTGQEPYSIAISLQEDAAKMAGWQSEIVATDLAQKVIDKAKAGIYSQFEAQRGLPIKLLLNYFTQLPDTSWQMKDPLRSSVKFGTHNLLEDSSRFGKFDIIFCRNVLIYFDDKTKGQVVERLSRNLHPHGVLMLGATETIIDEHKRFKRLDDHHGVYQLA